MKAFLRLAQARFSSSGRLLIGPEHYDYKAMMSTAAVDREEDQHDETSSGGCLPPGCTHVLIDDGQQSPSSPSLPSQRQQQRRRIEMIMHPALSSTRSTAAKNPLHWFCGPYSVPEHLRQSQREFMEALRIAAEELSSLQLKLQEILIKLSIPK